MKKGDLVTVPLENNRNVSNTFIIYEVLEDECILYHPLDPRCKFTEKTTSLDKVAANVKDSTERNIEFAMKNQKYLDFNTLAELEALTLYFIINRSLTTRQKGTLSNICGNIASIYFNNEVRLAMEYIKQNEALLDDFNSMWYNNFRGLFTGKQPITSPKQRASIFNIAGFVLAELESQKVTNGIIKE